MDITEIKRNKNLVQKKLSAVNEDFLEFVAKNPDTLKRSNFKAMELSDPLFSLQPWPTFISRKTQKAFADASEKLCNLVKRIPKRVFNNDPYKISNYFGVPATVVKLQLDGFTDDHIDNLLARGDFIVSSTGIKCLEFNVTANIGGLMTPKWEFLSLNTPVLSKFFKEYKVKTKNENLLSLLLEHLIRPLGKYSGDSADKEINIALVVERFVEVDKENSTGKYLNELYKELLARKGKSLKGEVFICDYQHLKVVGDYVFFRDKKIHALLERYHGVVPPSIQEVFKSGNVIVYNGPITNLLSNKLSLAVLSDYDAFDPHAFSAEEKEIIDTYVPWTRRIAPGGTFYGKEKIDNLEDFILSNRETLIIKPGRGLGGDGVCVGRKSTKEEWEEAVKTAYRKKGWLVQEFVESAVGLYQCGESGCDLHDMVWGFFVFGSRYTGEGLRVMPQKVGKGVLNCHQGATISVVFLVDE